MRPTSGEFDLNEGSIIEQDVRRVTHASNPEAMIGAGWALDASVLAPRDQ